MEPKAKKQMKLIRLSILVAVFGVVGALIGLGGCSDRHASNSRLLVASKPEPTRTSEEEWLHKLQMINVTVLTEDTDGGAPVETTMTVEELAVEIEAECNRRNTPGAGCGTKCACINSINEINTALCEAKLLLAAASEQADPITLSEPTEFEVGYSVPQQSEEASEALAEMAVTKSRAGLEEAYSALDVGITASPCVDYDTVYSRLYAEAYYTAKDAFDRAIEATVNVSDKMRSTTSSPTQGYGREMVGEKLSRAAAAHLLVGGTPGIDGSVTQALCLHSELTPESKTALQLFRQAAPDPVDVLDATGVDIDHLVNGPLAHGSIRERLFQFYGASQLATAAPGVEKFYKLSRANFEAARAFLAEEIRMFGRASTAQLEGNGTFKKYAGTASDAKDLPASAWAALARLDDPYSTTSSPFSFLPPMSDLLSVANLHASEVLTHQALLPDEIRAETVAPFAMIQAGHEVLGELRYFFDTIVAFGFSKTDRLRVVVGEEGLRCAVNGSVDGANCDGTESSPGYPCTGSPTLACLTLMKLDADPDSQISDAHVPLDANLALPEDARHLYLVRPRNAGATETPGQFEVLAGFRAQFWNSLSVQIVPTLEKRVGEVLAPNSKYCAVPQVTCSNVRMDARLPLEDELTSDGDGIESSWKHYLALARQAATEADELGSDYINTSLNLNSVQAENQIRQEENWRRAEEALQAVQSACGTAVDSKRLVDMLSGNGKGQPLPPNANGQPHPPGLAAPPDRKLDLAIQDKVCGCAGCGTCDRNFSCRAGRCALDFGKVAANSVTPPQSPEPDLVRLAECLDTGPGSVYPFITLGDQPLCVTVDANNPNKVCTDKSKPCPYVQPSSGVCKDTTNDRIATPLNYFVTEGDSISPETCRTVNVLRKFPGDADAMASLQKTGILHPTRVSESVAEVTWDGLYGGYSKISYDSKPRASTGSVEHGPAVTWPCSAINTANPNQPIIPDECRKDGKVDGTPLSGLFCTYTLCDHQGHDLDRGKMNDRLLRATLAASLMRKAADGPIKWDQLMTTVLGHLSLPGKVANAVGEANSRTTLYDHDNGAPVFDQKFHADTISGCHIELGWNWVSGPYLAEKCDKSSVAGHRFWTPDLSYPALLQWAEWDEVNQQSRLVMGSGEESNALYFRDNGFAAFSAGTRGLTDPHTEFWANLSSFSDPFSWTADALNGAVEVNGRSSPSVKYTLGVAGTPLVHDGTLNGEAFLDGLELLCDATQLKVNGSSGAPAGIETFADVARAGDYLKGLSNSITRHAGRMIFPNIPKIAVDAGRETSAIGVVPALGGKMAEAVTNLRRAELQAKAAVPVITGEMNQFSTELKALGARLAENADLAKIRSLNLTSTVLDRLTECANALMSAQNIYTFGANGVVNCANSVAQIALATQINDLQSQAAAKDETILKLDFGGKAALHARALQAAAISLGDAAESIDQQSAVIEGLKKEAQVNLAKALYLSSWQSSQAVNNLRSLGALKTDKKARYEAALQNARLMANLAKRSIEQRLGVRLSQMRDDLPLVAAPSTWEGTECTLRGIDYAKLGETSATSGLKKGHTNYTDGFIGDYVTKLSNLVESYRLQNDFHEGNDTAVVSLRDDVFNVRKSCDVRSSNLLFKSADLDYTAAWRPVGCEPIDVGGSIQPALNCVAALPRVDSPFVAFDGPLAATAGYDLRFGDGNGCAAPLASGPCGWQSTAALVQSVTLDQGTYRFSWYTKESGTNGGAHAGKVVDANGTVVGVTYGPLVPGAVPNWNRASLTFTVATTALYNVGFGLPELVPASTSVTVAAAMLEHLPLDGSANAFLPSYERTDLTPFVQMPACEDSDGEIFRHSQWQRECLRLCDSGFSNNCTNGPTKCYQQASFGVSQSSLTNGKLFNASGFARGNFNYRINSVALNFVGTGIRRCADSSLPSTCNGGGFVTYSLDHQGPFFVRNYDGKDFQALLFDGHIEQARGLATERYITNPMSSSDSQLLGDYTRKELQGRPLDGNFTVRIWEDDEMDFNAIKDVQVVLNYSYWTRFN